MMSLLILVFCLGFLGGSFTILIVINSFINIKGVE